MSQTTLIQDRLKASLARTKGFQDFVSAGVSDPEGDALGKIFFNELPAPENLEFYTRAELDKFRPYAIVEASLDNALNTETDAAFAHHIEQGTVEIILVKGLSDSEINGGTGPIVRGLDDIAGRIIKSNDDANPGLLELVRMNPGENFWFRSGRLVGITRSVREEEQEIGQEAYAVLEFEWGFGGSGGGGASI